MQMIGILQLYLFMTDLNDEQKSSPLKSFQQNLLQRFKQESFAGEYKLVKKIMKIELSNETYRSELFDLNETVTKILQSSKLKKTGAPTLESQLTVVAQELVNLEKLMDINRKQLKAIQRKQPSTEQLQTIADSNLELKNRQAELEAIKKEVKMLSTKNKGAEYRLNQYSQRGRQKSVDSHAMMMKEAVNENKVLRRKLEDIEDSGKRKQEWTKLKQQTTKDLQKRVSVLPAINSSRMESEKGRSSSSSSKLEAQKKIYQKWFMNYIPKNMSKVEKQIEDFQKITLLLGQKISGLGQQIQQMQTNLVNYKQKITPVTIEKARTVNKKQQQFRKKQKNADCNCDMRFRQSRRDWIGKFDGLRFSDSRHIKGQTRLFRVVHNNVGYYQFSYYSVSNPQKLYVCPLPFSINAALKGKQSSFTVAHPDYIKIFKLRINPRTSKIFGMELFSNLGFSCQFLDALQPSRASKHTQQQNYKEISYVIKVNANEAPALMFGSYRTMFDQKKNLIGVHLQGLGVEMIQDYVQEVM